MVVWRIFDESLTGFLAKILFVRDLRQILDFSIFVLYVMHFVTGKCVNLFNVNITPELATIETYKDIA